MKLSVLSTLITAATAAVLHPDNRPTTASSITIHATHGPAVPVAVESDTLAIDASSSAVMSSPSADRTDEHFYISPAMLKRDDPDAANVNKDVNCHKHADCDGGTCLGGICIAEPSTAKRDVAKDVNCYGDIDCDGGSCFNNICIAEPSTKKRDGPGWGDIGGTCAVDKDCGPGNSCLAGVCVDKPPAKPPVQKRDGPGWGEAVLAPSTRTVVPVTPVLLVFVLTSLLRRFLLSRVAARTLIVGRDRVWTVIALRTRLVLGSFGR